MKNDESKSDSSQDCNTDVEEMLTITVSVYIKKRSKKIIKKINNLEMFINF